MKPNQQESLELERQLQNDPFLPKRGNFAEDENPLTTGSSQADWEGNESMTLVQLRQHRAFSLARKLLIAILLFAVVSAAFFSWTRSAFHPNNVSVQVSAPNAVDLSQDVEFTIEYKNDNRAELQNASITFYYPAGFSVTKLASNMKPDGTSLRATLGTIPGSGTGKMVLTGRFLGDRDALAYLKAVLQYTSSTSSETFETSSQATVALRPSSLVVDIDAPLEIAAGSVAEYVVTTTNTADTPIPNVRFQATFPDGFTLSEADPRPSEGSSVWSVGLIEPHQKKTFRIKGSLAGEPGELKNIKVSFGVAQGSGNILSLAATSRSIKLIAPPVLVLQTVNGQNSLIVKPGDQLTYAIKYINKGSVPLRNLIVTLELQTDLFDASGMQPNGGVYDASRRVITWKVSDHAQLALVNPGESGVIDLQLKVRTDIDLTKNPTLLTVAKVDSLDIPLTLGSGRVVASKQFAVAVAAAPSVFASVQKVPGDSGNEQQFVVQLSVQNTSHILKDAQLKAFLSSSARWIGLESGEEEHLTFSDRTNELVWDLGGVAVANTNLNRKVRFRASSPSSEQVLNQGTVVFTATDTVTNEPIRITLGNQ